MKILHLDSSIKANLSASRVLSAAIVDHLRASEAPQQVVYRDLVAEPLSHFTFDPAASQTNRHTLADFKDADVVVIGAALYNFTISSQLKAWLDRVVIADETFRSTESGPIGLASGKRVIVGVARGGVYAQGSPFASSEHAETLLRSVFGFIGIDNVEFIIAEGLAMGEDVRAASISRALEQIRNIPIAIGT
jgi:FMN-dependent NADH-azoreductase